MGSFNSRAASKQHPMPVHLSNKNVKTNEQRKEVGESLTNIIKSDEDECEGSQNVEEEDQSVEEEDPCNTKRRNSNTSSPKRPANVRGASYIWLASSPITQDEDNLMKGSAVKCMSPRSSILISPSRSDRCQSSKQESIKATHSRPQFYSYPKVSARTKPQSAFDVEKPSCLAGISPFSAAKTVRRSKSTSKSSASNMILTRSVGFGVDKPAYSYHVQRY